MIKLIVTAFTLLSIRDTTAVRSIPSTTPAKPGESNKRSGCENEHPSCGEWADSGECTKNPGYMHSQCRKSCGTCANIDANGNFRPHEEAPGITSGISRSHKAASLDAIQKASDLSNKGAAIMHTDETGAARYFRKALKLAPNQLALLQLGRMGMNSQDGRTKAEAYGHLERAFDEDCVPVPIDINSKQGYYLANLIARCAYSFVCTFNVFDAIVFCILLSRNVQFARSSTIEDLPLDFSFRDRSHESIRRQGIKKMADACCVEQ